MGRQRTVLLERACALEDLLNARRGHAQLGHVWLASYGARRYRSVLTPVDRAVPPGSSGVLLACGERARRSSSPIAAAQRRRYAPAFNTSQICF